MCTADDKTDFSSKGPKSSLVQKLSREGDLRGSMEGLHGIYGGKSQRGKHILKGEKELGKFTEYESR